MSSPPGIRWGRVLQVWLLIVVAESVHGVLRQLLLVPLVGDFRARQWGVLTGSVLIFAITRGTIHRLGAPLFREQLQIGAVWVGLIVLFELGLGSLLGYSWERMFEDYNLPEGGLLGLGLIFLLFAPALAAVTSRQLS